MTPSWARFDDLTTGTALRFPPPHRVVTANCAADVADALATVDDATARGAWAYGYVAYEAAPGLDPALAVRPPLPEGPPLLWFGICAAPTRVPAIAPARGQPAPAAWRPEWSPEQHARRVHAVRRHIEAGDVYQCNLTDRLRTRFSDSPLRLYARLANRQAGAFHAFMDLGRFAVAGASPELFFDWSGDRLTTRPMKGTARRGSTEQEDEDQARRLLADPKERAENLMIVDLLRNDLSRVARTGSVEVPRLFTVERYPTVWQLTSEITARIPPDVGLVDVFRALFPCGSVTGAPKARAMEVIRDLETAPRGVYSGALGYVAPPGGDVRARFSVAIRTAVVDRVTGTAEYGAGGGITWDSDARAEHEELLIKASILGDVSPPGDGPVTPASASCRRP